LPLLTERQTNRRLGPRVRLTDGDAAAIAAAAATHGARLQLVEDADALDEVGRIIGAADRVRLLCPATHQELVGELRWSRAETEQTRDGISVSSLYLEPNGEAALQLLARPDVAAELRALRGGSRLEDGARDSLAAASAAGLLTLPADSPETWLAGGRALQRLWLEATRLGIAVQPLTVALYMFEMLRGEKASVFSEVERTELEALERRLYQVFAPPAGVAALLFRLSRVDEPAERSLRLPPDWVLTSGVPGPVKTGRVS
jgi:hypothetical protein